MPKYTWKAIYSDGTSLKEYDKKQHLFREINQNNLIVFEITDGKNTFSVDLVRGIFNLNGLKVNSNSIPDIDDKYKLVWFKRTRIAFYHKEAIKMQQFVIGLECETKSKKFQQLIWVQEDGSVVINGLK